MKISVPYRAASLMALTVCLFNLPAQAGRPLAVDDANVNDKGAGHVEIWVARDSDKINTWNVAPAFAPVEGVEVGVSYAKARKSGTAEQAIQAKWRITPSQEKIAATWPALWAPCMKKVWATALIWSAF